MGRRVFLKTTGSVLLASGAATTGSVVAQPAVAPSPSPPPVPEALAETTYARRTDSLDTKIRLLEEAFRRGDHRIAQSLVHSLRSSLHQTTVESGAIAFGLLNPGPVFSTDTLPAPWKAWCRGWSHGILIQVSEIAGENRTLEPVEIGVRLPREHVGWPEREVRLAAIQNGSLREVPSQVLESHRRGADWVCRLLFQVTLSAGAQRRFLVLFGNPDAELPQYESDLVTVGEGYALDIENAWFKAALSRQNGQLERLTLKREHGLELFSGGQGHGEPPAIDWAHDYVTGGNFQKMRISLWDQCPEYEVHRGPLCTTVRRWGLPHSPIHPVFSPARLHIDIEYRFFAGLPWFLKLGSMEALQTFEVGTVRDDEWVFSGHSFTDALWMGPDGKLQGGEVPAALSQSLSAVGLFNPQSRDAFIALFLEHSATGISELRHTGAPTLSYKWHGQLWSRGVLPVNVLPAGAVLRERNAYITAPFGGLNDAPAIEALRRQFLSPLQVSVATLDSQVVVETPAGRLARPGESGESVPSKRVLWEALQDCKDAQLYTADVSVVELGLVRDIRVRGGTVHVVMTMPHRGRPLAGYFVHGSISVHPTPSVPIRERLLRVPGVERVSVEQVWDPVWNSGQITDAGRRKLGLDV